MELHDLPGLTVGQHVAYHGSLPEEHGIYAVTTVMGSKTLFLRNGNRDLYFVRPQSVTLTTAPLTEFPPFPDEQRLPLSAVAATAVRYGYSPEELAAAGLSGIPVFV